VFGKLAWLPKEATSVKMHENKWQRNYGIGVNSFVNNEKEGSVIGKIWTRKVPAHSVNAGCQSQFQAWLP
jgi:hypothetical protein